MDYSPPQIEIQTISYILLGIVVPVLGYMAIKYVAIKSCLSRLEGKVDALIMHFIPEYNAKDKKDEELRQP